MKFQFEIDLEAIEGNPLAVAHMLIQIASTLTSGAWPNDLREKDDLPRMAEIASENMRITARVAIRDEAFSAAQEIVQPAAVAPLNDPLNTRPIKETLQ